ncbi:phloretin 4'-O-glucosyltransferase-like [Arachis stenosperma]|uniref:phloretin 4'-O-glucosyltransferase-like n=1 Tax=Arachis stenosperma TaxID=217475 RepID=UPI0025ABEC5E|nr:phloretin 4'-O-glucosyltransferase-like [Arachis stenosperma]
MNMVRRHRHHHFLVVPYPVQGHINPALQFSKRLLSFGANVTLLTTLYMHRRMSSTNSSTFGLSILPFSDGHDAGFTASASSEYSLYFSELRRRGTDFVTDLILSNAKQGHPFTCVVYTLLQTWAAEVARGFHLPTALLWIQPATVFDIFYHYFHGYGGYIDGKTSDPSSYNEAIIELPGLAPSLVLAPRDMPAFLLPLSSKFTPVMFTLFEEQFRYLDMETKPAMVLLNTFEELEAKTLRAVDDKLNLNMMPIGPLISSAYLDGRDLNDASFAGDMFHSSDDDHYIEWLESKAEMSVVYVSFGSVCVVPKKQMEEIARALLDCGGPFLWVIREKVKVEGREEEEEEGLSCMEEVKMKGKIVKWCSQVEVLSHRSVRCFVTHCGWNSVMESLVSGVPMVAFPQGVEQRTNAKLIEDVWKTGVRVDHSVNEEGMVEADEIGRCLDIVMGNGEKGNELRKNAEKWKCLGREAVKEGGSSNKNLRNFLDDVGEECLLNEDVFFIK